MSSERGEERSDEFIDNAFSSLLVASLLMEPHYKRTCQVRSSSLRSSQFLTSQPEDFPIHCFCDVMVPAGQSRPSSPSSSLSAYLVISRTHCEVS